MSLYKIITKQLSCSGFEYSEDQLQKLDIIEYIMLESAGALHCLQGKPLQCTFRPGHSSNIILPDKKVSSLEFGLSGSPIDETEEINFCQIVSAIQDKFPEGAYSPEDSNNHRPRRLYAFILPDKSIEKTIKSSSLFHAAGDLSGFDLESLLLLRKKLNLYKIADEDLSALVEHLTVKINAYLSKNFALAKIEQTLPVAENKFQAMLAFLREEYRFNQSFRKLNYKLDELINKGWETHEVNLRGSIITFDSIGYDAKYLTIAPIATKLKLSLTEARNEFFNNPISQESFETFQNTCLDAIQNSKEEFGKFRGWAEWYNELHPFVKSIISCIKAIGGIIAAITVIPAVLTATCTEQGYIGTFFKTRTGSLRDLTTFKQELCAKNGIFDALNKEISSDEETDLRCGSCF